MAKGDKPVGRLVATVREGKRGSGQGRPNRVEIGTLWPGKYPGTYSLTFAKEDRPARDPKWDATVAAHKVLAQPELYWFDIRLTKAETERMQAGAGGDYAPDSDPADRDGNIPF